MTAIDEARAAVGVVWVTPDPELPTRQQPIVDPDALANLIREVERETKAAMPCYGCSQKPSDGYTCSPCRARAEKENT